MAMWEGPSNIHKDTTSGMSDRRTRSTITHFSSVKHIWDTFCCSAFMNHCILSHLLWFSITCQAKTTQIQALHIYLTKTTLRLLIFSYSCFCKVIKNLTCYGNTICQPAYTRLWVAISSADQCSIFSRRQNQVSGCCYPVWSSWV